MKLFRLLLTFEEYVGDLHDDVIAAFRNARQYYAADRRIRHAMYEADRRGWWL